MGETHLRRNVGSPADPVKTATRVLFLREMAGRGAPYLRQKRVSFSVTPPSYADHR